MISAPDRRNAIELIDAAVAAGASCKRSCKALDVSLRTYQRWTKDSTLKVDGRPQAQRREPANKLTAQERDAILVVCNDPAYQSLPPTQIVPALADQGVYLASESSFYRVLKAADQVQHRGRAQTPRQVSRPKSFKACGPNQVWSWDITYLATLVTGLFYRLYLVMDIYSRKIVAWEIHEGESAEQAATLIRKACMAEGITRQGLVLHSDNGSPMKGATMLATLQKLGVVPSFSRPSVSNDNPYSESLFGTMKYTPSYPSRPFGSLDAARAWVHEFVHWYNEEHRHSGIRFVTPAQRHKGDDSEILSQRDVVYTAAKRRHPERWRGNTRDWSPIREVWLNPDNASGVSGEIRDEAA